MKPLTDSAPTLPPRKPTPWIRCWRFPACAALALAFAAPASAWAQGSLRIELSGGDLPDRVDPVVRVVPPPEYKSLPEGRVAVFVEEGRADTAPILGQKGTVNGAGAISLRLDRPLAKGEKRTLTLREWRDPSADADGFRIDAADGRLRVAHRAGDAVRPVLDYHTAEHPAPQGASPLFARSGFVHPLWSPAGAVLTDIRPSDHLHHMGLWHAWTRTDFRGRPVDFWNLKEGQGTVRFGGRYAAFQGPVEATLCIDQEQVALPMEAGGREEVVLRETLTIRAWTIAGANVVDYDFEQTNVTDAPLELPAYRYGGGIAYRGPAAWTRANSDYLTSEGRRRDDGHTTRARWCIMAGGTAPKRPAPTAGVAILCHPDNHDAPQRQRIWDTDKEGKVFFNYVPTQESAWAIKPGEMVRFRYRVVAFDGEPDPARIDALWAEYANPPQAVVSGASAR